MQKVEKTEAGYRDMKLHYENLFAEQVNHVKKLVKERELLQLYTQRLEAENSSLVTISSDHETTRLLTYASQTPATLEVGRPFRETPFIHRSFEGGAKFNRQTARANRAAIENQR